MSMSHPHHRVRPAQGFTIIEVLVTIGILVIIAVGVSTIFTSISETVNTGKRVSEINRIAAQLERIMRQDFENMTRDGFLVIAHQHAVGTNFARDVQLSPGDATGHNNKGRPRRVDEIMFFSRGQYESSRRAVSTAMVARSSEAAIYYGHGQKRVPDLNDPRPDNLNNLFFNPQTTDTNIDANALLGTAPTAVLNPNQYARDWSLLRHITLLAQPQSAGQALPDDVYGVTRIGTDRQWLEDSQRQIALQPAGRSIFNSLSQTGFAGAPPVAANYDLPKWYKEYQPAAGPVPFGYTSPVLRASGLLDIVTDDLASIRTTLYGLSSSYSPITYWDRGNLNQNPLEMDESYDEFALDFWDPNTVPSPSDAITLNLPVNGGSSPHFTNVRKWMIDALPSLWDLNPVSPAEPIQLSRVRYEDIPTRLLYDDDAFGAPTAPENQRKRIYAEADQEMLGSSVFIPQCTEFVVEWSFGFIDASITDPSSPRYKKMLWYGMDRWIDSNKNGLIEPVNPGLVPGQDQRVANFYSKRPAVPSIPDYDRGPDPQLIVGHPATIPGFGPPPLSEIATFGYPDINGTQWPWPKFIRITLSIADTNDLTLERTFQMIFDIPDASNN
ncbi:MAG: prepilin-type N-terminal cleavage/methylation domain-containing protein [Phycisphaerales bacterium]|nr:prepilin-type N-terminal cleavage/methylation domain-containing protein [Phycisphaerales bacterium]